MDRFDGGIWPIEAFRVLNARIGSEGKARVEGSRVGKGKSRFHRLREARE